MQSAYVTLQQAGLVGITGSIDVEFREESQTTDSDFTNHTQVPREQITQVAAVIGTGGPDYMKLFPNLM